VRTRTEKAGTEKTAFYALGRGTGGFRDWLTLLHPPYTLWHLSYVAIGAALVPHPVLWRLGATLLAFFLAVGVGAHALDELNGRPLSTGISSVVLVITAAVSIAIAVVMGLIDGGLRLLPFVITGAILVCGYNLELAGGLLHSDFWFGAAWGAFPVLVGGLRPALDAAPGRAGRRGGRVASCPWASARSAPRPGRCAAGSRRCRSGSPGATAASRNLTGPTCLRPWSARSGTSPGPPGPCRGPGGGPVSPPGFDVVVAGAGPAGSVAALVLARGGARVALVDKAAFPRDKACGDLVGPRGVGLLDEWACPSRTPGSGADLLVIGPSGHRSRLPAFAGLGLSGARGGHPPGGPG